MKTVRLLLILSMLLGTLLAVNANASDTIRIGAVLSASGPASFLGEPERNTLEMLVDQLNAKGGVLGKEIDLIIYDDETDVNKCVLAADKLLKKDRVVAVLGPTTSGNTLAIANKFPRARVPMISCSAAEKIVKPVNPWVFKTPQTDRHAVNKILSYAKAQGQKRIAILTVSNGFGQAGRAVLKDLLPEQGFEMIADEVYGPKDTDMTAQLTKIKGLKPDAIVCWGTNPGPAVVARNSVQLGLTMPLYMSHGVASKKFIELAGEAANGIMLPAGRMIDVAQIPADNPQKPVLDAYVAAYQKRFDTPVSTFGGYAHDALLLTVAAIEKAGSAEPQAIRDALETIQGFVGATGEFNFSAKDHNGLAPSSFVMVRIENNDWKVME